MATAFYRGSNTVVDPQKSQFTTIALAGLVLAGAVAGFTLRPIVDDRMFLASETCERSPVSVDGHFAAYSLPCRVADAWTYGDVTLLQSRALDKAACELAALEPTDGNLEACTGVPVSF